MERRRGISYKKGEKWS